MATFSKFLGLLVGLGSNLKELKMEVAHIINSPLFLLFVYVSYPFQHNITLNDLDSRVFSVADSLTLLNWWRCWILILSLRYFLHHMFSDILYTLLLFEPSFCLALLFLLSSYHHSETISCMSSIIQICYVSCGHDNIWHLMWWWWFTTSSNPN